MRSPGPLSTVTHRLTGGGAESSGAGGGEVIPMAEAVDERLDVVAVAPHPDDLEITCGGTLAKLVRQGYRVGMIDLTSGEPTPRGSPETRVREAEAARRVLGVPVRVNAGLPNRELMDVPAHRYVLATLFRLFRPGCGVC